MTHDRKSEHWTISVDYYGDLNLFTNPGRCKDTTKFHIHILLYSHSVGVIDSIVTVAENAGMNQLAKNSAKMPIGYKNTHYPS